MKKILPILLVVFLLVGCVGYNHATEHNSSANSLLPVATQFILKNGDVANCPTGNFENISAEQVQCLIATATATTAPVKTPTSVVQPDSITHWHLPGAHDGEKAHEHGDAPPQWANDFSILWFDHVVMFGGDERSSPTENVVKHPAFKGVLMTVGQKGTCAVEVYLRYHAASLPSDRMAEVHSYEIYSRDCKGGISFQQGVYWTGRPGFRIHRITRRNEFAGSFFPTGIFTTDGKSIAPGRDQYMIGAPDLVDWNAYQRCEQWYTFAGKWSWDFSITICGAVTFFAYDEHLKMPMDQSMWQWTGATGLARRFEITHEGVNSPRGGGVVVPLDKWFCMPAQPVLPVGVEPLTDSQRFKFRPSWGAYQYPATAGNPRTCPAGTLPQYWSISFPSVGIIAEVNNTQDLKTFPGSGIVLPKTPN